MLDHPVLARLRAHGAAIPIAAGVLAVALALTAAPGTHHEPTAETGGASAKALHVADVTPSAAPTPTASVGPPNADPFRLSLSEPTPTWSEGAYEPDLAAVQDLLDRRSAAAESADVDAFVATSLTDEPARSQAEAIAALPVGEWSYAIGGDRNDGVLLDGATVVARRTFGPDAYVLRTDLRYRLAGYDRTTVTTEHAVTVVHEGGQWWVVRDVPSDGSKELWDFGPLRVVEGASTLVVGLGADAPSRATLEQYATAGDIGVRDVSKVWGSQWQERALIVAPPTEAALGRALGRAGSDYAQIAAVTTAELGGAGVVSRGDRVFVNPKAFAQLGPSGRTIVLRHEITHVATDAASSDDMPTWMEEGFADYVGYRGAGVSRAAITSELTNWVANGERPSRLPTNDDYANRNGHLVETYEESWLAAQLIADTYGRAKLVELYDDMRSRTADEGTDRGTENAFETVLGVTLAQFTGDWRAEVRALAG